MKTYNDSKCGMCGLPPACHAVTTHGRTHRIPLGAMVAHPFRLNVGK